MSRHKRKHRMSRLVGLYDDVSRSVAASGAPGHLLHHVERPFGSPEIGDIQHGVSTHDHDGRNSREVQTFCHHLRAYEYLGFPLGEVADDLLVAVLAACGVKIHPQG